MRIIRTLRTIKHLFYWILIFIIGLALAVIIGVIAALITNNIQSDL